eukprot:COSAG06_NODE_10705_length_1631_cov_10.545692_1_plen_227_part_00
MGRTAPHRTAPHRTASRHTAPHHTTPRHTAPRHTTPRHATPHRAAPHRTTPHRAAPRQQSLPLLLLTCLRANFQGGRSNTICLSKGGTVVGHARPEYGPNPTTRRVQLSRPENSHGDKSAAWQLVLVWSQASREKLHPCDPPEKVRAARLGTTPTNGGRGTQIKAQDRWVPEHPAAAGKLTSNLPASPPHLPGVNAAPSAELQSLASGGEPKLSEGTHARRLSAGA